MSYVSKVFYTASGSSTPLSVPFPFISKTHVSLYVDGIKTTAFSWINSSTITPSSIPTAGKILEVRRETPKDIRLVDFSDGSTLTEADLDTDSKQMLYIVQEAYDSLTHLMQTDNNNSFDAEGLNVSNLKDPIRSQDAVTLSYLQTALASSSSFNEAVNSALAAAGLGSTLIDRGDALITVVQPSAGAVARSQHAKNSDLISILDYDTLASALASGGMVHVPPSVTQVDVPQVNVPQVLQSLNKVAAQGELVVAIPAGVHSFSTDISTVGRNGNITVSGAALIPVAVNGVLSVAGTMGNWDVTYDVSNTSGVYVGQVLKINDVSGGQTYFESTPLRRPYDGELAVGFNRMGEISCVAGALTATLVDSANNKDSQLVVGDQVIIRGQQRTITGISTAPAKTITVDAPWDFSVTGMQWWYYAKAAAGTISTSGSSTTITGAGTSFLSRFNVGDVIIVNGFMREITGIASDTSLTVASALNLTSSSFSAFTSSILHVGSYEITAVGTNQITVKNKSNRAKPPIKLVSVLDASVIPTVLKQGGSGDGFVFSNDSSVKLDKIAIVGSGSNAGSVGLLIRGKSGYSAASVICSKDVAVIGFGRAAFATSGCTLNAPYAHFCNNLSNGVELGDGAMGYLRGAVVSHNSGIGLMSSGGHVRISTAIFCGNGQQGTRQDVGSSMYGDSVFAWGNVSHGFMLVNDCGIQFADGYTMCNGANGGNFQNAAQGRVSRTLFGCNALHGLSVTNCNVEATQTWQTGARSGQSGVLNSKSQIDVSDSAQTGNGSLGIFSFNGGATSATNSVQTRNTAGGNRADDAGTLINTIGGLSFTNGGSDYAYTSGGRILNSENPYGNMRGTHFTDSLSVAADTAEVISGYNGKTLVLTVVSSSSSSTYGILRLRVGSSAGCVLISGAGITTSTAVLTGTTGVSGDFTISSNTNGNIYIENRRGVSYTILIDIMTS